VAGLAGARSATLLAAREPEVVHINVQRTSHPAGWGRVRDGLLMSGPGRLSAEFAVPYAGVWDVGLEGETMPAVRVEVDGRRVASVKAQLDGNSLVQNTITPLPVSLSAGRHRVSLLREGFTLAPGNGGTAVLYALYLTPAKLPASQPLDAAAAGRWRSLCGRRHEWVEVVRS